MMRRAGVRPGLAGLALALATGHAAQAQWSPLTRAPEVTLPAPMPAIPRPADLVAFDVGAVSSHRFAIDPTSVRPDGTRFVRLTLVVTSASGVANVSYEAFDCESGTHRLLAIGHADGSWQAVAAAPWISVRTNDRVLRQHQVVYTAACEGSRVTGDAARIVRRLTAPVDERYLR